MNIGNKISKEEIDNVRLERESALNPPESEPGMSDFDWDDDFFGESGSSSNESSKEEGGMFEEGGFGSTWTPPQGNQVKGKEEGGGVVEGEDFEDKLFNGILSLGKSVGGMVVELVKSFPKADAEVWLKTMRGSTYIGLGLSVIGLLLLLFKNVYGVKVLIGGLMTSGVSIPIFTILLEKVRREGGVEVAGEQLKELEPSKEEVVGEDSSDIVEDYEEGLKGRGVGFEREEEYDFTGGEYEEDYGFMGGDDEEEYDFKGGEYGEEEFEINDEYGESFNMIEEEEDEGYEEEEVSILRENVIEQIKERNTKGIMTRQYLYDMISPCLESINPKYDRVKELKEGSSEFELWDAIIQNSAKILKGAKDTEMPYLISAKEKLFYILLEINRPKWLKSVDKLVTEVVNICSYDESKGVKNEDIYGLGDMVGSKIYIKIMKGETTMVSLKDTYREVGEDIKNPKNYMPVVLGLDAEGGVVWRDLKMMDSLLVTGQPRSGKSWFVQSILTQMCMWLSPKELEMYILDPKGVTSDFYSFRLPQVKKFVSDDEGILRELRKVVKEEAKKRTKIIGGAGCVNIWDYKKKNPEVEMPLKYILIDEVITLAERMDKETKEEFNSLLLELVSRLPNLGIRVIMIPHLVKDNILKKSITDLIPCRISVRGDVGHIEKSTGVSKSEFSKRIKLKHQGDMAVKMNNDGIMFVHGAVLTDSNEGNNELFEFLTKLWNKLEPPEEVSKGVVMSEEDMKELLEGVHGKK